MATKASASYGVSVCSLAGLGEKSLGDEMVQNQRLRTSSQASFPRSVGLPRPPLCVGARLHLLLVLSREIYLLY